jgi:hypothetical protein
MKNYEMTFSSISFFELHSTFPKEVDACRSLGIRHDTELEVKLNDPLY